MRGSPKPIRLQLLEGNPGHRTKAEIAERSSCLPEPGIPDCPPHLKGEARKEWKRVCREMEKVGILTPMDRSIIAVYCLHWVASVDAHEKGEESRWLRIDERLCAIGKLLGLDPSSRTRIHVQEKQPEGVGSFARERSG